MNNFNVGSYSVEEKPEWLKVGNYSSIAEKCYFHHDDNHACVKNPKLVCTTDKFGCHGKGETIIGHDVWLGRGVQVLSGVKIGDGAIVAAHTVVTKDVPPFAVVAGNPGRIKKYRFTPEQIAELYKIEWWNWGEDVWNLRKKDFEDIDGFIEKYRRNV